MNRTAKGPGGAPSPEFAPYVYGAAAGRPSRGRPENVLARIREQEEQQVGDGRHLTGRSAIPGGASRNGLPEPSGYVYRGTGRDELTSGISRARLEAEAAGEVPVPAPVTVTLGKASAPLAAAPHDHTPVALSGPRERAQDVERAEAAERARLAAACCPECGAPPPEHRVGCIKVKLPDPVLERHRKCGYPMGSLGCRITCGSGS